MPGGMQVPPEPVDLSSGDHPHCEQHGPEKRSEGEASSQDGVQAVRRQVNPTEACIVLRGMQTLTYLACHVSQSNRTYAPCA
jgi:hypothetical protein